MKKYDSEIGRQKNKMGGDLCIFFNDISAVMITAVTIACATVFIAFGFVMFRMVTCYVGMLILFQLHGQVVGSAV